MDVIKINYAYSRDISIICLLFYKISNIRKERSEVKEGNFRYIFMKFTYIICSWIYRVEQYEDCNLFVNIFKFKIMFEFGLIPK